MVERHVEGAVNDFNGVDARIFHEFPDLVCHSCGGAQAVGASFDAVVGAIRARKRAAALGLDGKRRIVQFVKAAVEVVEEIRGVGFGNSAVATYDKTCQAACAQPRLHALRKSDHRTFAVALHSIVAVKIRKQLRAVDARRCPSQHNGTRKRSFERHNHFHFYFVKHEGGAEAVGRVNVADANARHVRRKRGDRRADVTAGVH